MKNLFLDDTRKPEQVYSKNPEDWHLVTTYKEFCEYLNWVADKGNTATMPKIVSFDYVLAEDETGMDCASFLADFCLKYGLELPKINVHSSYPSASTFIRDGLRKYAKTHEKRVEVQLVLHNA